MLWIPMTLLSIVVIFWVYCTLGFSTCKCACLPILGNLPVERAKDTVYFLQWCGVSLVSSYAVCFLQRGGVSLVSSAIIYNIVKVKVIRWPVNPFDPLTHRPVDVFEKEAVDPSTRLTHWPVDLLTFSKRTPQGQLRGPPTYTVEMWPVDPFDPLTCRPVDLLEKEPLKGNCEVHVHTPLRCSAAKGTELDSAAAKQKGPFAAVWREAGAYII